MVGKDVKKKIDGRYASSRVGLKIKELRERLGVSQSVFAEHLGVKQTSVSDWESGAHPPSAMALMAIGRMDPENEVWWYEQAGPQFLDRFQTVRAAQEARRARVTAAEAAGLGWDPDLLRAVIERLNQELKKREKIAPPEKFAEMVILLYEHCYSTKKWDSAFAEPLVRIA